MTQEFHLSVTPARNNVYTIRTESVPDDIPLGQEEVVWQIEDWLAEASLLMDDPLLGVLRSGNFADLSSQRNPGSTRFPAGQGQSSANLVAFGQRLYNSLFQGTVRDSWMMAQAIAQHRGEMLRLRLGIKGNDLHRLPWEVLYMGDRPLATGTEIVFSRYHVSFSVLTSRLRQSRNPADPTQPLRILMVLSAPSDQDVLALKQEAEQLRQELQTVSQNGRTPDIELTILEQPGREQLTQALENNHYQVLHYAGHSSLGASGGSLYLVSNKTGLTEVLSGDDLAGLLVNNGIRIAVLNSCRSVYTAATDPAVDANNGNLAEALIRRGIPAVLAMAERIPDDVALNLSRLFYRNIKQGYSVDLSLSRARQGLISSYGSNQLYWALPILYLHPEFDGNLMPTSNRQAIGLKAINSTERPWATQSLSESDPLANNLYADSQAALIDEEENFSYFDDPEFDDPMSYPTEEEKIARLVNERSQSPTLLETEDLLYSSRLEGIDNPPYSAGSGAATSSSTVAVPASISTAPTAAPTNNPAVYSELTNVLAGMGALTQDIVTTNQAVQANPNSAEAYTNLGWALYQKGYLNEATSAYNQAIRLDAKYANAFNRLGLVFYQQGRVKEAIQAYNHAVELDPTLTEASTNLRDALSRQATRTLSAPLSDLPPTAPPSRKTSLVHTRKSRQTLAWRSIAVIVCLALLGYWAFSNHLANRSPNVTPPPASPAASLPADLTQLDAKTVATLGTTALNQGKFIEVSRAVDELLDRVALEDAEQVLKALPAQAAADPNLSFSQGRLAWQLWLRGNRNSSVKAARQHWEQVARTQPTAARQNALGFAYYAEGNLDQAEQAWQRSLRLIQDTQDPATQSSTARLPKPDLTAHAGLALVSVKLADKGALNQQLQQRSAALKLRDGVLAADPVNFQPIALSKNWMWSETAIQDWQTLLAMK